ncbi:MAG: hypothetical protein M3Z10_05920 [Gemmatimonadota bacterium]|nr:hypothetical protein [Gemmatimonadota bacterium]
MTTLDPEHRKAARLVIGWDSVVWRCSDSGDESFGTDARSVDGGSDSTRVVRCRRSDVEVLIIAPLDWQSRSSSELLPLIEAAARAHRPR